MGNVSGTRRPALVFGGLAFLIAAVAGLFNSQLCVPCAAVLLGLAAGYSGAQAERPATSDGATRAGAAAGAASGVGALLGHLVGGLIGAARIGPQGASQLMEDILSDLGVAVPAAATNPLQYYGTALCGSFCFGAFEVLLMAGLGALGGLLWQGMRSRGGTAAPPLAQ
jgi:hypothetical protein